MRTPDLIIGPRDNPQTSRWHLFKWRGYQFALHKWHRSDDDRALHDHTGDNISILLNGRYREFLVHPLSDDGRVLTSVIRYPFIPYFRKAETPHRVQLLPGARPVWSLWFRFPPRREWGFHCPRGWRHWREYCRERDYNKSGISTVGRGCD